MKTAMTVIERQNYRLKKAEIKARRDELNLNALKAILDTTADITKRLALVLALNPVLGGLAAMTVNQLFYRGGFYSTEGRDGQSAQTNADTVVQSVGEWIVLASTAYAGASKPTITITEVKP